MKEIILTILLLFFMGFNQAVGIGEILKKNPVNDKYVLTKLLISKTTAYLFLIIILAIIWFL